MKNKFTDKKTKPVPARGGVFYLVMLILLMVVPTGLGIITSPWSIDVNGESVAVVASKEEAEKAIEEVIVKYENEENDVLDIQIIEDTEVKKMALGSVDKKTEVMTVEEAEKKLLNGDDGDGYLTVVVTKEKTERELIEFDEEIKPESELYVGEKQIAIKGEDGIKETKKIVVCENGKTVQEEVVEEELVKEPIEQIVLTGTKAYEGYGGDSIVADAGVSYDENATYDELTNPVDTISISSPYGPRWGRLHHGLDFGLAQGSNIYAADEGKVYFAANGGGYGNLVKIDHGNGMQTYYAHCSEILVSEGQYVETGEVIALVGSTGNSTGPHLHFEVIVNGVRVDPLNFINVE